MTLDSHDNPPVCEVPECTNIVTEKRIRRGKPTKKWKKCCSKKCENILKVSNSRKTIKEKYGVENPMELDSVKLKIKESSLKKYGVENPAQAETVKKKTKETIITRYGCEHPMLVHSIKEKVKNTNMIRYGVENPTQSKVIREKIKRTNFKKYGVDNAFQDKNIKNKIKETNIDRYGVPHSSYISIGKESYEKLNNIEWCREYISRHGVVDFCNELNISRQTAIKYLTQYNLIDVSKSYFEREIQDFLESLGLDYICRSRKIIPPLEIDFVVGNLAIECNGTYWHSEGMGKARKYHIEKTNKTNEAGLHMVHLWEHEWRTKGDLIKSRLKSLLGLNDKIFARKTTLRVASQEEVKQFLNENHIQGNCPHSICYALYYKDMIVAVMTFGKSRFNKNYQYELLRYCSIKNINVVGGAGKLFSAFIRDYDPSSVISYSDKSWNKGNLYKTIGFVFSHTSSPSYKYTKNGVNIFNRINFQKHKLKEKLDTFDPKKTEWQNMTDNGYDRIWDCGNDVYVWNKA